MLRSPERVPELRRRAGDWLAGERLIDDECAPERCSARSTPAARLVSANLLSIAGEETRDEFGWIDEFPRTIFGKTHRFA